MTCEKRDAILSEAAWSDSERGSRRYEQPWQGGVNLKKAPFQSRDQDFFFIFIQFSSIPPSCALT